MARARPDLRLMELDTAASRSRGNRSLSETEQWRWVVPLVLCFAWAAGFFMAAIGTGRFWLLGPAALGFALIILGFVYLGLTSDTNDDQ